MGEKTTIEWATSTWNPLRGVKGRWSCIKVSPGCTHCYAERLNVRFGGPKYVVGEDDLRLDVAGLVHPRQWKRPRRIFVCSMTDLFEERVPDEWIAAIFGVMGDAKEHTFLVLTKRAERMHNWFQWMASPNTGSALTPHRKGALQALYVGKLAGVNDASAWPLPNVWLGVSAENQRYADERIPWLLKTPAVVRFVSLEPVLGPINLSWLPCSQDIENGGPDPSPIQWVITGGESGGPPERSLVERYTFKRKDLVHYPKSALYSTPDALAWVRLIRDQCVAANVPFFFKQWGGPTPKAGGRLLDGREWNEYPR